MLRMYPDYQWLNPEAENFTPQERPYSYSPFYIHGCARSAAKATSVEWSDRLKQSRPETYRTMTGRFGTNGDYFFGRGTIEARTDFLSGYLGRRVEITAIAEHCHPGNGYPYWQIWHKDI